MTSAEVAGKIGRAVHYYGDIERGTCGMSIETLLDLSHYQNFYEFPKFRIKLLILILLHFNIVRIIY